MENFRFRLYSFVLLTSQNYALLSKLPNVFPTFLCIKVVFSHEHCFYRPFLPKIAFLRCRHLRFRAHRCALFCHISTRNEQKRTFPTCGADDCSRTINKGFSRKRYNKRCSFSNHVRPALIFDTPTSATFLQNLRAFLAVRLTFTTPLRKYRT